MGFSRQRVESSGTPHFVRCFGNATERPQNKTREQLVRRSEAGANLYRPSKTLLRLPPLAVACVGCSQRGVGFGEERVQLYGFFGRRAHFRQFVILLRRWNTLERTKSMGHSQSCIGWSERRIFGYYLFVAIDHRLVSSK